MTYEQWDAIADAYIPLLLIITLLFIVRDVIRKGIGQTIGSIIALVISIVIAYAIMFIDIALNIWPSFESDYSTHTALALVFVCYFSLRIKAQMITVVTSLLAYFGLMVYQQYHTVLDILSTTLVLLPLLLSLQILNIKYSKSRNENEF